MLYIKRLVVSMLILLSLSAEAEEVLGVETFSGENVVMLCVEGKVYVNLYNALVKTIWEVNGTIEHLKCQDYEKWRKENEN